MTNHTKAVFKILVLLLTISVFSLGCQNPVVDTTQPVTTTTAAGTNTTEAQIEPEPEAEPVIPTIKAYATVYPVYELARLIGQGAADVEIVVPPGADAHDFEPSAKLVGAIEGSSVMFYNGLGLEHWLENLIGSIRSDFVSIQTSSGIETLPIDAAISLGHDHDHDHDHSHDHGSEDPHVWLDPQRAMIMAQNILDGFILVDPDRETIYRENYADVITKLEVLDRDFEEAFMDVEKRDIVVGHAAFGYLTARYNLKQYAIAGISPLEEPSAAQLREITHIIRDNQIRVIFYDVLANPKFSEVLAQETGTITAVLNPLEGITADQGARGADFFMLMYENLEALKKALIAD